MTGARRRSSATRAAPSWRASWPRRRAPGAPLPRCERDSPGPMRSAGSPACSSCAASASRRSPRGACAADAFAAHGDPAGAAVELLVMANQRRMAARHGDAIELAQRALQEADRAERLDLRLRALGLEGMARAKRGDHARGVETVRDALAIALDHDTTVVAADLYQRLSVALDDAADFRQAEEALETALELCAATGDTGVEVACVTCLAYVLRERGERRRAAEMCRELVASGTAVWVAEGLLGAIHAYEGRVSSARRMLTSCRSAASKARHHNMTIDSTAALARVAAAEGADEEAREHSRSLLALWQQSDDRHYAIAGLRWGASWYASRHYPNGVHECTQALSRIASQTGHADALAALGSAIGESALARRRRRNGRRAAHPRVRAARRPRHAVRAGADRAARRRSRSRRRESANSRSSALPAPIDSRAGSACARWQPKRHARCRGWASRRPARRTRGRARGRRRPVTPRARSRAPPLGGAHESRDRGRPLPEPAHRRHARAQHPAQARLPIPRRSGASRERPRAARRLAASPSIAKRRSALGVFLRRSLLELEPDEPLVADDPRVVAGLDDVRVARADLDLGSVLVLDGYPAGVGDADVAGLAALGSGDGLDAFRPPPPRLEREPRGGRGADAHHIHLRLVGRPRLVRRIEVGGLHTGHGSLLSSIDVGSSRSRGRIASERLRCRRGR